MKLKKVKYGDGILTVTTNNVKTYRTLTVHELITRINTVVNNPVSKKDRSTLFTQ